MLQALYPFVRPLFFSLDAERAHTLVASMLALAHRSRAVRAALIGESTERLPVSVLGHTFSSPVMMAAGFDKHASMYNALYALGFGAVEVGTITAKAQPGNDRPRLFRLVNDRALINRMGFNNDGAAAGRAAIESVERTRGLVLGVNIGKSKVTPVERAAEDYAESARQLGALADYLVVNVSSPNTPGLRSLQAVEQLEPIVTAVRAALREVGASPPLLVKIAPDLADEDVDAVADFAVNQGLDGLVATNTTVAREGLGLVSDLAQVAAIGAGGLSGPPVRARSLAVLKRLRARVGDKLVLIAAGGIENADQAWESVRAGASLVQVYTAFVYKGPGLARELTRGLRERMARDGFDSWESAVGVDAR
ncbi:MAG: quinone-dependent dihydroorotate dehydrogenase [Polyangiales bacterium]